MATKTAQPSADNLGSRAPVEPCGYIYVYPKEGFPFKEASLLGNKNVGASAMSLPLLSDLTVESNFSFNVKAVHKKIDMTTLLVRVSAYHREAIVFFNTDLFEPIFVGPGLDILCSDARSLFGYTNFVPRTDLRDTVDIKDLYAPFYSEDSCFMAVVVTEGFKERLYFGNLVPIIAQGLKVQINGREAVKIPLYDEDLFSKSHEHLPRFYIPSVSKYLHDSVFTSIAQALRIRDVESVIRASEKQSIQDQYKLAKIVNSKDFSLQSVKCQDASAFMVIDCIAAELAMSYGLSFLEAPQDPCAVLDYTSWPIFETAETEEDRIKAIQDWNAMMSVHVYTHLFSTNSVLYLTKINKQTQSNKSEQNVYNTYFMQHGLAYAADATQRENGEPAFSGAPKFSGGTYTLYHLALASSFSPHLLARNCYYMQFCQHQKSTTNANYSVPQYVGTAAASDLCELCQGTCPASCIHTLFYRLKDRFPPVLGSQRRDPYVVTGVSGQYNDLDMLGNFATFREKEDEAVQNAESEKYTYWQLIQNVVEKLSTMGVTEGTVGSELITDIQSFLKTFRDIDNVVDSEVVKFMNCLVKNNINFRETIKTVHHVLHYCCNVFWQAPCAMFLNLFYKSVLAIIQDICLPIAMTYEQDNPSIGMMPSEWLKVHYQTIWTNFKSSCLDRGVLTGSEHKIVHTDMFCDFLNIDSALSGQIVPMKMQVRLAKALLTVPKTIKIKNRIVFSNSSMTETIQSGFIKSATKKDSYIVTGPYMKFLNSLHKVMFPNAKISALYLWHTFSQKKQLPVLPGISRENMVELANYVETSSKMHDDMNVLDIIPTTLLTYAKVRLNNTILRTCGQTQFYATTLQCLLPTLQTISATEYPHVLLDQSIMSVDHYLSSIKDKHALTVQTTLKEDIATVGKQRPIVTVPLVVNKYTGINGNTQIFQCGNLGYFMGRGVDRNLIPDSTGFRRQNNSSYMRRRHVFMTPMVAHLVKKNSNLNNLTFEVETIRKNVQNIFEDKDNLNIFDNVVLELVKGLGDSCENITEDDLQFYLGEYYIMSDEIWSRFQIITDSGAPWSVENVTKVLGCNKQEECKFEFVGVEEQLSCVPPQIEEFAPQATLSTLAASRKRKITSILSDIDL
ncbi:major ssDNA-binding protein [Saimiriine gammaherpesvirus 2]|uniref:Major DNA-binding protein n=1 Tax=Saimiriine herpesvirus 2 (strain 11) TaxID=10383 RepID=DNBI_SHV21|nr:major ssDNA-binding protein [Saimiriine gammaherpesvirus 2]P24910.1 RecName: Full=Major DNA-binding protein [Herpesvirus saimiri (strain 11)]pir/DNBEM1/ DNA-binding protein - saimiriine herpesvirus 1 (strain 11) [Saimiriine alphaherpesvirus 1]AAA46162.1 major DNA binding protein [Saimiriine gammaherpesvirus 2]CAA45629.1 major ssDNA-binding protein [Saimiriine gammaherpesvirus 2]